MSNMLKKPSIYFFAPSIGILVIFTLLFRLYLNQIPFINGPLVEFILLLAYLASLGWSIIYIFKNFKSKRLLSLVPITINIGIFIMWWFISHNSLGVKLNYQTFKEERETVIEMIKNRKLQTTSHEDSLYTTVHLPLDFMVIANKGDVRIYQKLDDTRVVFFIYRGLLGNFSFVYSLNDRAPIKGDFGCRYLSAEKLDSNWYWIGCP